MAIWAGSGRKRKHEQSKPSTHHSLFPFACKQTVIGLSEIWLYRNKYTYILYIKVQFRLHLFHPFSSIFVLSWPLPFQKRNKPMAIEPNRLDGNKGGIGHLDDFIEKSNGNKKTCNK